MYGYETFHEDLMKNLIESVHNGVSSHAYIFEGEKGLGVLNSARLFAAALTCEIRVSHLAEVVKIAWNQKRTQTPI